jgi:hypothetical protein
VNTPRPKKKTAPKRTKLTKAALAKALELQKAGLKLRQIVIRLRADGIADVTHQALSKALSKVDPATLPAPDPVSSSAPKRRRSKKASTPEEVLQKIQGEVLPQLDDIRDAALNHKNLDLATKALTLSIKTAQALIAARPPDPPDPGEDPANTQARDEVRTMLAELARRYREGKR